MCNNAIENYKSIQKLKLELGRVTVLIGENGCGKSNILEAIALSAAAGDKLDNEFLAPRGIREPELMRAAFDKENVDKEIKISVGENEEIYFKQFIIYSPEYQCLRNFREEGQIRPLGINGEGLFKLLTVLYLDKNKDRLNEIKEKLKLIGWFKYFQLPNNLSFGERFKFR